MAPDGQMRRPIRVLIADDDPRVRLALRTFLAAHPWFEVIGEAGTSATALELAREHSPAVAVVDVLLPEVYDGLELLRSLTTELRIPVIAISLETQLADRALAAGASRFLSKDGTAEHLVDALRAAVPDTDPYTG